MQDPIEALLSLYRAKMPKTVYLMRNEPRYSAVKHEIDGFVKTVLAEDPDAEVMVEPDELTGSSISVSVITDLLVLSDTHSLLPLFALADNIEVCARTDGRCYFDLSFQNCYKPAPAHVK